MTGDNIEEGIKEHFATFDRANFADWLKEGLRDSYSPFRYSEKLNPFDPVYWALSDYESLPLFLSGIYDEFFSDSGKRMFREAIGDVLVSQISKKELPTGACEDLIYLISSISAEESLDSLVSFAGKAKLEEDKRELYATLSILMSFKLSNKVYEAVERLADSPNFDDGYLFQVIELLVENRPSNTRNILEKFESRIKKLWNSLPDDVKEREAFLDAKDNCLKLVLRKANPVQYEGTWLTKDYKPLNMGK